MQAEKYKSRGSRKCVYFISPRSLHLRPAGASLRNSLATAPCKEMAFCSPAAASPGLCSCFSSNVLSAQFRCPDVAQSFKMTSSRPFVSHLLVSPAAVGQTCFSPPFPSASHTGATNIWRTCESPEDLWRKKQRSAEGLPMQTASRRAGVKKAEIVWSKQATLHAEMTERNEGGKPRSQTD